MSKKINLQWGADRAMKDFNVKQKKSKWSILVKDFCEKLLVFVALSSSAHMLAFMVAYVHFNENPQLLLAWIMDHWYLFVVGGLSIVTGILILLCDLLRGILYKIYRYIAHLTFLAYLPLTIEDLKNNHVKNQKDFVMFLIIYKRRKVKILSQSYNTEYVFDYPNEDFKILRDLFPQFPASDSMSKEFEKFYEAYLKKYDMEIKDTDISNYSRNFVHK